MTSNVVFVYAQMYKFCKVNVVLVADSSNQNTDSAASLRVTLGVHVQVHYLYVNSLTSHSCSFISLLDTNLSTGTTKI